MTWRVFTSWRWLLAIGLMAAVVLALFALPVCTDRVFVDETTGSRRGYRQWFFGARSGQRYKESALEQFIRTNQPGRLQQRWTSYAETRRNLFGRALSAQHVRPSAVLLLRPEDLALYCAQASTQEKRQLYATLASGDQARITEAATRILISVHQQKTTPPPRKR